MRRREAHLSTPHRLQRLIAAQENLCAGCGKPMLTQFRSHHPDRPTIDHAVPTALGGSNSLGNLIAMHKLCNETKGDDIPTGCELIWLLAVNARIGFGPQRW